jgi:uncharacterized protein
MNADEILVALEDAEGIPEAALRAAVQQAASLAPAVIEVMQRVAGGRMPLPREERLLRFGLHALAAARETTACPAFLALLKRPALEVDWLFGEDRATYVARLLLGLFDGDDAAVHAQAAERSVDPDARAGLLSALARLVWEGRTSREALVDLLDRIDRDGLEDQDSFMWYGWQSAIMLLGLTDWIERVERAMAAGRHLPLFEREVDRKDWLERTRAAAEHPEDPQRFIDDGIVPVDDPVADIGWSAVAAGSPDDALNADETSWLDQALLRRFSASPGTMIFEEVDGYLTALAAGPVRVPVADALPPIWGADTTPPRFDTPEHDTYVAMLLGRHLAAIERSLAQGEAIEPWITYELPDFVGALWARGYAKGVAECRDAWQPLIRMQSLAERLMVPLIALMPDPEAPADERLLPHRRRELIKLVPIIMAATWSFWHGRDHPLLDMPRERAPKIGRNELCPCGSGRKYKRCCGAVA